MSITDPAEVVQPEGQGDAGTSEAPYAEYLSRLPEEIRGDVEPVFRDWDAGVTKRFQEASELRNTWTPYAEAGINQYPPEQIQAAFNLLSDPEQARQWLDQQYGPIAPAPAPTAPQEDPYGAFQDPSQQQLEQLLSEKLNPLQQKLEQYEQRWQDMEQQRQEQQIADQLNSQVAALKQEHAASLPQEIRDNFESWIERFAGPHAQPGANPEKVIASAWTDLQQFMSAIEKNALQAKVDAPKPAESGGVPDVSPTQHRSLNDPGLQQAAREFLRNNNRA